MRNCSSQSHPMGLKIQIQTQHYAIIYFYVLEQDKAAWLTSPVRACRQAGRHAIVSEWRLVLLLIIKGSCFTMLGG